MHIVTAGVHTPVLRTEGERGLLSERERIHIRAKEDDGARACALLFTNDTAFSVFLGLVSHLK